MKKNNQKTEQGKLIETNSPQSNGATTTTPLLGKTIADSQQERLRSLPETSPFCRSDCKVCNSLYMPEIHEMVFSGKNTYRQICEHLKITYNFHISPASLTRHLQNYRKSLNERASIVSLVESFDDESDDLARNQKQATQLADFMYKNILERIETGTLDVSISDWEKIVKLRHSILSGDGGAMGDLLAIFQKASNDMGASMQQGVLFKKGER